MRFLPLLLLVSASSASWAAKQEPTGDHAWLLGVWEKTQDEDRDRPDSLKFQTDDTFVSYGPSCEEKVFPFHIHKGNVYLDVAIPGKGPVALVYRPNQSRTALTFTSPRTLNNATYERVPKPTCGGD